MRWVGLAGWLVLGCSTPEVEVCDDLLDNDGDGEIDCADADCDEATVCVGGCPEIESLPPLTLVRVADLTAGAGTHPGSDIASVSIIQGGEQAIHACDLVAGHVDGGGEMSNCLGMNYQCEQFTSLGGVDHFVTLTWSCGVDVVAAEGDVIVVEVCDPPGDDPDDLYEVSLWSQVTGEGCVAGISREDTETGADGWFEVELSGGGR